MPDRIVTWATRGKMESAGVDGVMSNNPRLEVPQ